MSIGSSKLFISTRTREYHNPGLLLSARNPIQQMRKQFFGADEEKLSLPVYLPWIHKSEVIINNGTEVTGSQGIHPSQFLNLIDPWDTFIGLQLRRSRYLR